MSTTSGMNEASLNKDIFVKSRVVSVMSIAGRKNPMLQARLRMCFETLTKLGVGKALELELESYGIAKRFLHTFYGYAEVRGYSAHGRVQENKVFVWVNSQRLDEYLEEKV